jgi:alpha-mannosidase
VNIDELKALVISETHWDRAWYMTFQQFRLKLVKLVDKLLPILENDSRFTHFTFDGQTVVLEDYLEVKPQKREALTELIQDGRILIGPWYVLPDIFLVSGEALLRNLCRGIQVGKEFGPVMKVGYIPDPFGHVSQMPLILHQFRIDSVIFARGTGEESEELGSEFIWQASDGTEVVAHWLPLSYGNIAELPQDVDDAVSVIEGVIDQLEPWSKTDLLLLMNGSDHVEPQSHLPDVIEQYNSLHEQSIQIGTLPMFVDHIQKHRDDLKTFKGEFRRSKYHNILSGVYSTRVYLKQSNEYCQRLLERVVEPWCAAASSTGFRYPNDEIRLAWKYLLRNHPHDDICGCSIDEVHEDMMERFRWVQEIGHEVVDDAYEYTVQKHRTNEPGVLILNPLPYERTGIAIFEFPASDIRFATIADVKLKDPALKPQTPLEAAKNEIHIAFVKSQGFDPTPSSTRVIEKNGVKLTEFEFDFTGLLSLFPQLQDSLRHLSSVYRVRVNEQNRIVRVLARKFDAEDVLSGYLTLSDENGTPYSAQLLDIEYRPDEHARLVSDQEEFLKFAIQVHEAPALGTKRLDLQIEEEPTEAPSDGSVECEANTLENNLVRVEVGKNGTILLKDKRTGEEYSGLLEFEDTGDVGDEYDYSPPPNQVVVRSTDIDVAIEPGYQGPLVGSLLIHGALDIPIQATPNLRTRSDEYTSCEFTTEITLYANNPSMEVVTVFQNFAEDHRLRVLIPTGTGAQTCTADSAFDLITRPIRPKEHDDWYQPVAPTYPMRSLVTMGKNNRGLTVATRGLLEFEVLEEREGTIAVTLLRSVGWLSRMGMKTRRDAAGPILETPDAQCLGTNIFEFAVTPWEKNQDLVSVYDAAEQYLIPLDTTFAPKLQQGSGGIYQSANMRIKPKAVRLSAFKRSEDGKHLVIRVWNVSEETTDCEIELGFDVEEAISARADEEPDSSFNVILKDASNLKMQIPGRGMRTVLLKPGDA